MKTLLLLAGRSTRFWPLTEKTLFPVCGKTLLEHQVGRLRTGGCKDIVLVGGAHNLKEAKSLFPDLPVVEQENLELGMRGALLSALPSLQKEPVMVVSGNDVVEPSAYKNLLKAAQGKGGALLARAVQHYFPGGYLTLKGERVTGIVEKPGQGNEPSDLVNIVAHIHNHPDALLAALKRVDDSCDDGYERALQSLLPDFSYAAVPYEAAWQAVKYPWHLLPLLDLLLLDFRKPVIHKTVSIHPTAVIEGPVVIGEHVKIMPHATVRGPCCIGPHTVVANNSLVRDSSIGEHCVIGYNTEVKRSVLHSHVWTHMSYIGDSVIGRNVSFGGGSMTANFRLDEQTVSSSVQGVPVDSCMRKFGAIVGNGCRLGIQVGLSPGIKVGAHTFIGSGAIVSEDIPDGQFARMKEGTLQVTGNRTTAPEPEARNEYRTHVRGTKKKGV